MGVSLTHWGSPVDEVKDALTAAAGRWGVPIDSASATNTKAATVIHAGSWERNPTPAPCCRAVRPVSAPREAWHA